MSVKSPSGKYQQGYDKQYNKLFDRGNEKSRESKLENYVIDKTCKTFYRKTFVKHGVKKPFIRPHKYGFNRWVVVLYDR